MIRGLLLLWLLPIAFFWSWYFISLHDLGFGLFFFSRELHEMVFEIYGSTLGVDPAALPGMVAKALVVDTAIVFSLVALKKHRAIARFIVSKRSARSQSPNRNSAAEERRVIFGSREEASAADIA